MFKQRLISGIILELIAFVTLYYGGFLTFFVVGAISLIGVFELLRVIQMEKSALGVIVYTGSVLYYLLLLLGLVQYVMQLALLVLILLIAVYVFTFPKYEISSIAISYFALFYVIIILSFASMIVQCYTSSSIDNYMFFTKDSFPGTLLLYL